MATSLALFVERLPGVLRKMLGREARLPRNVFTDRGTGMYIPTGLVVAKYNAAIDANDFNLYWGIDAQRQSPDMGDILLHETAVSWFRSVMKDEKPVVPPWEETLAQWTQRARRVTRAINRDYNVAGLCREFPQRLADVVERQGDRLRKWWLRDGSKMMTPRVDAQHVSSLWVKIPCTYNDYWKKQKQTGQATNTG
jgi:hypothetical protein